MISPGSGRGLPDVPTIATLLSAHGYTTGHFGKWHLGLSDADYLPTNRGFDQSLTWYQRPGNFTYLGAEFIVNDAIDAPVTDGDAHSAHTITQGALDFIDARHAEELKSGGEVSPYFLNVWYRTPHSPIDPPAEFPNPPQTTAPYSRSWPKRWNDFTQETTGLGNHGYENHDNDVNAKNRSMYAAMITYVDHQIGLIVDRIDSLYDSGRTLIIVTSDNGATRKPWSNSGGSPPLWDQNGGLRSNKGSTFEGGIRVPLIARWPTRAKGGGTNDSRVLTMDLFPTFMALAGIPEDRYEGLGLKGQDVSNALLHGAEMAPTGSVFWETKEKGKLFVPDPEGEPVGELNRWAVRKESIGRKLVVERGNAASLPMRLFDLTNVGASGLDEREHLDISKLNSGEASTVNALDAEYRKWRLDVGGIPHVYNGAATTADVSGETITFRDVDQRAVVEPHWAFKFREGDFSFAASISLRETPTGQRVVAHHPGSWKLYLDAGPTDSQVNVKLDVIGKRRGDARHPGTPGSTKTLVAGVSCKAGCRLDLAFTIFGWRYSDSSLRLYVDGLQRDSYNGAELTDMHEVYASNEPITLGNLATGGAGWIGSMRFARFYQLSLTPREVRDPDRDGLVGPADNCPYLASGDFADSDGDGLGDACDEAIVAK